MLKFRRVISNEYKKIVGPFHEQVTKYTRYCPIKLA